MIIYFESLIKHYKENLNIMSGYRVGRYILPTKQGSASLSSGEWVPTEIESSTGPTGQNKARNSKWEVKDKQMKERETWGRERGVITEHTGWDLQGCSSSLGWLELIEAWRLMSGKKDGNANASGKRYYVFDADQYLTSWPGRPPAKKNQESEMAWQTKSGQITISLFCMVGKKHISFFIWHRVVTSVLQLPALCCLREVAIFIVNPFNKTLWYLYLQEFLFPKVSVWKSL